MKAPSSPGAPAEFLPLPKHCLPQASPPALRVFLNPDLATHLENYFPKCEKHLKIVEKSWYDISKCNYRKITIGLIFLKKRLACFFRLLKLRLQICRDWQQMTTATMRTRIPLSYKKFQILRTLYGHWCALAGCPTQDHPMPSSFCSPLSPTIFSPV